MTANMPKALKPVAVVGMGCRLPGGSSSPDKLWEVLSNGKSCYSKPPTDRFNVDSFQHQTNKIGTIIPNGAHFIKENVAAFDAPFFNIAPGDAKAMDPQQRMLLEVVYESLENAGLRMEDLVSSNTSCHVGSFTRDWCDIQSKDAEAAPKYTATGIGSGMLANRVSWFFDWRGPSLTLDTACSSSLVALHLACNAIQDGEANLGIVAGTNLILNPDMMMWMSNMSFLSKDGLSKTFDASANGYGRGEGMAVVVLKPLDDALRDGDCIRAVIRGTGVNQDGHTTGITLPSPVAQADLIRSVYKRANLSFNETKYFEAHGTGTSAGDTGELMAISNTISQEIASDGTLYVGSIKSNIGHTEGTAGLAGLIKTILILEKGIIPPNVHLKTANPKIPFDKFKIHVPTAPMAWPSEGLRRASVNSFGYGGTNAHVIIDDAASYLRSIGRTGNHNTADAADVLSTPSSRSTDSGVLVDSDQLSSLSISNFYPIPSHRLLVFTAHESDVVQSQRAMYAAHIKDIVSSKEHSAFDRNYLNSLAYTLSSRRSVLPWKDFVVAQSMTDAVTALDSRNAPLRSASKPRVAFIFTGQGAQWAGMGKELLAYDIFKQSVTAADDYLRSELGCQWSVLAAMGGEEGASEFHLAKFSQPMCTILQIALVELLHSWGIEPVATVGHSSGEIAAAVAVGALTREAAWKIAFRRGELSSSMAIQYPNLKGAMLAAGISVAQVQPYLEKVTAGRVQVACSNSPESVTLSGDETGIDEIEKLLQADGLFARKLKVENAYHSYHMGHIAEEYLEKIADCAALDYQPTRGLRMVSSVTGTVVKSGQLKPSYWVDNLVSPVQFSDALAALLKEESGDSRRRRRGAAPTINFLLEIGPHAALQGPVNQILRAEGFKDIHYSSVLKRGQNAAKTAVEAAGTLFTHGLDVDINAVNQVADTKTNPLVDLPTYPWNHSKLYWAESRVSKNHRFRAFHRVDLLGAPVSNTMEGDPSWRNFLRTSEKPWIRDHKIQSSILYPGAGMLCMVIEAARQIADVDRELDAVELRDIRIDRPMIVPDDENGIETKLQFLTTKMNSLAQDWYEFRIASGGEGSRMELNCYGFVALRYKTASSLEENDLTTREIEQTLDNRLGICKTAVDNDSFYSRTQALGLGYGPAFQNLTGIHQTKDSACATLIIHDTKSMMAGKYEDPHIIHPTTLDCMFQLLFAALQGSSDEGAVPVFIQNLKVAANYPREAGQRLKGFADVSASGLTETIANIVFGDENDLRSRVEITGLKCRAIGSGSVEDAAATTVKQRYGSLRLAPDLRLASSEDLMEYVNRPSKGTIESAGVLSQIVELVIHAMPYAKVLEIGSGDSLTATESLLSAMEAERNPFKSASWAIANLDDDARDRVTAKAREVDANIAFETVKFHDTSKDEPKYDAILITSEIANSSILKYAAALLKPAGQLLVTTSGINSNAAWPDLCNSAGLDRVVEILTPGILKANAPGSIVIASRVRRHELLETKQPVSLLLPANPSKLCLQLATDVTRFLEKHSLGVTVINLDPQSIDDIRDNCCISLIEVDHFVQLDESPDLFKCIKKLVLHASRLLWVTVASDPRFGITTGIFRAVKNENPSLDLVSVALGATAMDGLSHTAQLIADAFVADTAETEFIVDDGLCQIYRYVAEHELNSTVASHLSRATDELMAIGDASSGLKMEIKNPGAIDTIYFDVDRTSANDLLPDEVDVEAHAFGINSSDVMILMGQLADPNIGLEASGIVKAVGSAVTAFKAGDRVYLSSPGCFKTKLRVKAKFCYGVPDHMSFTDVASIPWAFSTALYAIRDLGRLQVGESLLIHAAAGDVGQAAIQLAKHYKAEIFATVGSDLEAQMLQDFYGIPKDHIFSNRDASFVNDVKRITGGLGVSVVLNSLSGELLRQSWHCLAPFGKFIELGTKDINSHAALDMAAFKRGTSFTALNLRLMASDYPQKFGALMEDVSAMLRDGIIAPVQNVTGFSVADMSAAVGTVQAGEVMCKVVVTVSPEDKVRVHPTTRHFLQLRADATYILVGGLGGLGRAMALEMAECGAKHLVFLSRSGPSHPKAKELCDELVHRGARGVVYSCDVADASQLRSVLSQCAQDLPPIAGCITGAMVLRDGIFENMSYDDFRTSLRPKVTGSWNLHEQLPRDMDFFIMLSSISGVTGNPGQANYAAGNTFMDELARYRRRHGLPATSVDLGLMLDVGFVAERQGVSNLKKWESVGIGKTEFLRLMSLILRGTVPGMDSTTSYTIPPQVVTGLATGGHVAANSLDAPFYFADARFKQLVGAEMGAGAASSSQTDEAEALKSALESATSIGQASEIITEAIRARMAKVSDTVPENIEVAKPLHAYGMDSLMAAEMRNWLAKEMRCNISIFDVVGSSSITELGGKIVGLSKLVPSNFN